MVLKFFFCKDHTTVFLPENILKLSERLLPPNFLSLFDHFVGLVLKWLILISSALLRYVNDRLNTRDVYLGTNFYEDVYSTGA